MDYKMLHGPGSGAASSRSTAERQVSSDPDRLRAALPDEAFETVDEVEDRLVAVAERAPADLVQPSLEALTSGGKRLRPLLLVLAARMGEADEEDLLSAATAIEVLHTATLVHDDIVDGAKTRRGAPTTVARYGREIAVAAGDYLFAETFSELAGIGDPRLIRAFAEGERNIGLKLLSDIMAVAPDAFMLMMRERNERDNAERSRSQDPDRRDQGREPADDYDGANDYDPLDRAITADEIGAG